VSQDQSPLIYEKRSPTATLRLNRPERLNAVSLPLYQAMEAALTDLRDDGSVRVALLTGTGRAFCAGADVKAHASGQPTADDRRSYVGAAQRVHHLLQTVPKPVVAVVNGHAIGAGLELALSCDFLVVAADAKLRLPELSLGTFVGGGLVYTLPQRIGLAKAKAGFRGVLVAPMLPPPIAELIVGAKQDPQFGPVLTVGPGGVNVELLSGAAVRALPITRSEADEMLDELRIAPLLTGFRGNPPADRASLITVMLAVAECLLAHPELSVIEVNPLFAYEDRAVSVDVAGYLRDIA